MISLQPDKTGHSRARANKRVRIVVICSNFDAWTHSRACANKGSRGKRSIALPPRGMTEAKTGFLNTTRSYTRIKYSQNEKAGKYHHLRVRVNKRPLILFNLSKPYQGLIDTDMRRRPPLLRREWRRGHLMGGVTLSISASKILRGVKAPYSCHIQAFPSKSPSFPKLY